MSFRLVPKSMTLNDLERRNGRYFALCQRIPVASWAHCVKVHVLLMSCCTYSCRIATETAGAAATQGTRCPVDDAVIEHDE